MNGAAIGESSGTLLRAFMCGGDTGSFVNRRPGVACSLRELCCRILTRSWKLGYVSPWGQVQLGVGCVCSSVAAEGVFELCSFSPQTAGGEQLTVRIEGVGLGELECIRD